MSIVLKLFIQLGDSVVFRLAGRSVFQRRRTIPYFWWSLKGSRWVRIGLHWFHSQEGNLSHRISQERYNLNILKKILMDTVWWAYRAIHLAYSTEITLQDKAILTHTPTCTYDLMSILARVARSAVEERFTSKTRWNTRQTCFGVCVPVSAVRALAITVLPWKDRIVGTRGSAHSWSFVS